jgi:hypothetical protein
MQWKLKAQFKWSEEIKLTIAGEGAQTILPSVITSTIIKHGSLGVCGQLIW